jgi:integrase
MSLTISKAIRTWVKEVAMPYGYSKVMLYHHEWNACVWEYLGDRYAAELTTRDLLDFQACWMRGGWTLPTDGKAGARPYEEVNRQHSYFMKVCRWLVVQNVLDVNKYLALKCVERLKNGRSDAAPNNAPVLPVDPVLFEQTLSVIGNMSTRHLLVTLRLTGMRPGEGVAMYREHLDFDSMPGVWIYTVPHTKGARKNAWRGKQTVYFIGPQAQKVIGKELSKTYWEAGPVFRTPRFKAWTVPNLQLFIDRTCKRNGLKSWNPSQLRKTWSNEVFCKYGAVAESKVLGHTEKVAAREYLEIDKELAARIARDLG